MSYVGRFAPSPTGPLHAGSVVAALASYLRARQHQGQWLIRLEDIDTMRCQPHWGHTILAQLQALGLRSDGPIWWQTSRTATYQSALDQLIQRGWAYPCACSRKDIENAQTTAASQQIKPAIHVYPGTCRNGLQGRTPRAWRLHVPRVIEALQLSTPLTWTDARHGPQTQDVAQEVGDFVLFRADGLWAYQLAVVVDDAAQGITHVVRGEDLADNTARQIVLQKALGLPTPSYEHTPLVRAADGQKLSKQTGAQAVDTTHPMACLNQAAQVLGLPPLQGPVDQALEQWTHLLATTTKPLACTP